MAKREVRPHFRTSRTGKRYPVAGHKRRINTTVTLGGIVAVVLLVLLLMAIFR